MRRMKGNVGERPQWRFAEFSRMGDLILKARLSDCSEVDPFVPVTPAKLKVDNAPHCPATSGRRGDLSMGSRFFGSRRTKKLDSRFRGNDVKCDMG
jgi:hypothetical protein